MKPRLLPLWIMLTLLWPAGAYADDAGLSRCAKIASPLDRLECYDTLARATSALAAPSAPDPVPAPMPEPAAAPTPVPATPAPAPSAPADPAPLSEAPENFGFENQLFKTTNLQIVAHYDGKFSGWSGGTLFKLDNGQVWKQAQSGRVSFRRDRPVITIRKGALGSFRLSVEGLNQTIRVKRVK